MQIFNFRKISSRIYVNAILMIFYVVILSLFVVSQGTCECPSQQPCTANGCGSTCESQPFKNNCQTGYSPAAAVGLSYDCWASNLGAWVSCETYTSCSCSPSTVCYQKDVDPCVKDPTTNLCDWANPYSTYTTSCTVSTEGCNAGGAPPCKAGDVKTCTPVDSSFCGCDPTMGTPCTKSTCQGAIDCNGICQCSCYLENQACGSGCCSGLQCVSGNRCCKNGYEWDSSILKCKPSGALCPGGMPSCYAQTSNPFSCYDSNSERFCCSGCLQGYDYNCLLGAQVY